MRNIRIGSENFRTVGIYSFGNSRSANTRSPRRRNGIAEIVSRENFLRRIEGKLYMRAVGRAN